MGLDTSHNCWHGAYSAFSRWRNGLAEAAGYKLVKVDYDSFYSMTPEPVLNPGLTDANFRGEWRVTPEDPLIVLLSHSDCDGEITARDAGPLADRLEQLLPLLPEQDDSGHIGNWQSKTEQFIAGLRLAALANEPVDFH